MNPPYSTSENRTLWIDRLHIAWRLLAPGGRLVAILPNGLTFRQDRRHRELRELVKSQGDYRDLPADSFISSGTGVRTVVAWMSRPTLPRCPFADGPTTGTSPT
ncbi:SAM-dependent methyltransferase [Amycolatopsis alba DSM 44262]|uniref:SAM-dependent methyltransferase n=2 Tax=Amycolatopsis alba TaxID=76020 RepID=A0A229RLJ8_AMYAL|nr:SAM-dependent methyltransferase [Amycolatopsis alba DSM 44262]